MYNMNDYRAALVARDEKELFQKNGTQDRQKYRPL